MRVFIEAGHGGADPGAVNGDIWESRLNLEAALTLKFILERAGYDVLLSRSTDELIPHARRTALAAHCDIALAVHHDTATARVAGVYYQSERANAKSRALANSIAKYFVGAWVRPSTNSRFRRLYIDSWRPPSVLLELGPTRSYTRDERIDLAERVLSGLKEFAPLG